MSNFAARVREDYLHRLNELISTTGNEADALIPQEQICDAALARDLLDADSTGILLIDLDDWPAAREFVTRVLKRHDIGVPDWREE